MPEQVHGRDTETGGADPGPFAPPRAGRRVRIVREPVLTGAELLAFAVIFVMVCGPLALGAFGL